MKESSLETNQPLHVAAVKELGCELHKSQFDVANEISS
jgi:hypothetical protein